MKAKPAGLTMAAVLVMAPAIAFAQGATFQSTNTDTGRNWVQGHWEVIEGTSDRDYPGEGDTAIIASGTVVRMTEDHQAAHLIVEGEIRGSTTISWGGGVPLSHTFGSVTVKDGGIWRLADGVGEGGGSETIVPIETVVTGDVVIENGGNLNAYRLNGADRATLVVEGDFRCETTAFRFAVFPRPNWTLKFDGDEPSTMYLTAGEASRNFTNIVIAEGKEVTISTVQGVYLEEDGTLAAEDDATLNFVDTALVFGPGSVAIDSGATVGFAGPGGFSNAIFQVAGTRTFGPGLNAVYTAAGGAQVGDLAPETMGSLTVDTPDFVFLNKDLTVNDSLVLVNGRLDTYDPLADEQNTLTLAAEASVERTNGWLTGMLARAIDASQTGPRVLPLGTDSVYTPVVVDITGAGTGTGVLMASTNAEAFDPAPPMPALPRYWTVNADGISGYTASLSLTWAEGDAAGLDTDLLRAARFTAPNTFDVLPGQSVDAGARTVTVPGVTALSDWLIVEDADATSVPGWEMY